MHDQNKKKKKKASKVLMKLLLRNFSIVKIKKL